MRQFLTLRRLLCLGLGRAERDTDSLRLPGPYFPNTVLFRWFSRHDAYGHLLDGRVGFADLSL